MKAWGCRAKHLPFPPLSLRFRRVAGRVFLLFLTLSLYWENRTGARFGGMGPGARTAARGSGGLLLASREASSFLSSPQSPSSFIGNIRSRVLGLFRSSVGGEDENDTQRQRKNASDSMGQANKIREHMGPERLRKRGSVETRLSSSRATQSTSSSSPPPRKKRQRNVQRFEDIPQSRHYEAGYDRGSTHHFGKISPGPVGRRKRRGRQSQSSGTSRDPRRRMTMSVSTTLSQAGQARVFFGSQSGAESVEESMYYYDSSCPPNQMETVIPQVSRRRPTPREERAIPYSEYLNMHETMDTEYLGEGEDGDTGNNENGEGEGETSVFFTFPEKAIADPSPPAHATNPTGSVSAAATSTRLPQREAAASADGRVGLSGGGENSERIGIYK